MQEQMGQSRARHEQLDQLSRAPSFDAAKARALADELGQQMAQHLFQRVQLQSQLRALLKAGADADRADNSGRTARDYAKLDSKGTSLLAEIEANAATDNPLVLSDGQIVSGGNFHAEPVGFAADMIAMALSEIGAIAQRRVALMVDPVLSFDLPAFLTPRPGLNSGLMIAEVTTAALMSENKHIAMPCVTDSTPTSANQEDHVSMAAHGARRLRLGTATRQHCQASRIRRDDFDQR
mgnify:CR=1 FL=1